MADEIAKFLLTVESEYGVFKTVTHMPYEYGVVYLPAARKDARWGGFLARWTTTRARADEVAASLRANGETDVLVVPVTHRRRWIQRRRSEPEE